MTIKKKYIPKLKDSINYLLSNIQILFSYYLNISSNKIEIINDKSKSKIYSQIHYESELFTNVVYHLNKPPTKPVIIADKIYGLSHNFDPGTINNYDQIFLSKKESEIYTILRELDNNDKLLQEKLKLNLENCSNQYYYLTKPKELFNLLTIYLAYFLDTAMPKKEVKKILHQLFIQEDNLDLETKVERFIFQQKSEFNIDFYVENIKKNIFKRKLTQEVDYNSSIQLINKFNTKGDMNNYLTDKNSLDDYIKNYKKEDVMSIDESFIFTCDEHEKIKREILNKYKDNNNTEEPLKVYIEIIEKGLEYNEKVKLYMSLSLYIFKNLLEHYSLNKSKTDIDTLDKIVKEDYLKHQEKILPS